MDGAIAGNGFPQQGVLGPTESYSVSCSSGTPFMNAPESIIPSLEVGVVAYYQPWPLTLMKRKFFRFAGANDGKKINWYPQPPAEQEEETFDRLEAAFKLPFP